MSIAKKSPKKILLFGGAFDPPHNGHLQLLKNAMAVVEPQLVLVMPTGVSPHKVSSRTPEAVRMRMCRCFLQMDKRVKLSDYEMRRRGKSYTADTVVWLQKKYPDSEIVLTLGSDMLLSFESWNRWQQLLHEVTLCCQSRCGQDILSVQQKAEQLKKMGAKVLLCPPVFVELSSSEIRMTIQQGGDISDKVPPEVAKLIVQKKLYQSTLPSVSTCKKLVRAQLSDKRYTHTLNVYRQAMHLCSIYGEDTKKAAVAALLHDYMKEIPRQEMLQMLTDSGIINNNVVCITPAAWHGLCAALVARQRLGISDEAVLSAIGCHTCGKAGMSRLDKIIYLADMTSAERNFDGVQQLRELCEEDLDRAMVYALQHTIDYLQKNGKTVDSESLAALQDLIKE